MATIVRHLWLPQSTSELIRPVSGEPWDELPVQSTIVFTHACLQAGCIGVHAPGFTELDDWLPPI